MSLMHKGEENQRQLLKREAGISKVNFETEE